MAEKKTRKNNTSREARDRWDATHLRKISICFRTDLDQDILKALDELKAQGYKTADAFRKLIRAGLK